MKMEKFLASLRILFNNLLYGKRETLFHTLNTFSKCSSEKFPKKTFISMKSFWDVLNTNQGKNVMNNIH